MSDNVQSASIQFTHDDFTVDVIVDSVTSGDGAADKAGVGEFLTGASRKVQVSLTDSLSVLGKVASAFSASLAESDPKPQSVEITFGLEASGEAGNFIISKVSGTANFSVKMSWSFPGGSA